MSTPTPVIAAHLGDQLCSKSVSGSIGGCLTVVDDSKRIVVERENSHTRFFHTLNESDAGDK